MPGSSLSRHLESGVDPGNEVEKWRRSEHAPATDLKKRLDLVSIV